MKRILLPGALALALLFSPVCMLIAEDGMRNWTSKDGTESVEGRFYSLAGEELTIVLPNGISRKIQTRFLSDPDVEFAMAAAKEPANAEPEMPVANPGDPVPAALNGKMVDSKGKEFAFEEGKAPKYYIMYYSASWCGPCRGFTPELVKFHKRYADKLGFEVVLRPSDKSEEQSLSYMNEYRMPWPGLKFSQKNARDIPSFDCKGIPGMLLVDSTGKKYIDTEQIGNRSQFLDEAKKIMSGTSG